MNNDEAGTSLLPYEDEDDVSLDESVETITVDWPSSTIMLAKDVVNHNLLKLMDKYVSKKGESLWTPSMTSAIPEMGDDDEEDDDELGSDDEIVDTHNRKCSVAKDTSTLKRLFEKVDECVEEVVEQFLQKYPHFGIISTKEDFTLLKFCKGDFHTEHIECTGLDDAAEGASRRLAVIVFMSDAAEKGGSIDFPLQGVSITPEKGSMIIFPACPLHPTRVSPVEEGEIQYTINYLL